MDEIKLNMITDTSIYFSSRNSLLADKLSDSYSKSTGLHRCVCTLGAVRELMPYCKDSRLEVVFYRLQRELVEFRAFKLQEDILGNEKLRPYQRVDVATISTVKDCPIFNEQRTGKTPTILTFLQESNFKNVLVVCPASISINWQTEATKWSPKYNAQVLNGKTPKKRLELYNLLKSGEKTLLITSYDTLRQDLKSEEISAILRTPLDALVIDEAHRLRNYQTQQSKAVFTIAKHAKHKYPMTGTPASSLGADVFGILHLINPDMFSSYWNFVDRYFTTYLANYAGRFVREVGKWKREKELLEFLDSISIQRKRHDVMQWIPEVTFERILLEPTPSQKRLYKELKQTWSLGDVEIFNKLTEYIRLSQISVHPNLLGFEGDSAKEEFILEWLENNDEPVVIVSCFTSYLKQLYQKLVTLKYEVGLLTGEQTAKQKNAVVEGLQSGKIKILIGNLQAIKEGFTLNRAHVMIFLDRSYVPTDNNQANDRIIATEPDDTDPRTIIDLVLHGTIDEHREEIINQKSEQIKNVNDYKKMLLNYM